MSKSFYIYAHNDNKHESCLVGPITTVDEDDAWLERIEQLQKTTPRLAWQYVQPDEVRAADAHDSMHGFVRVAATAMLGTVTPNVRPPPRLPAYARQIDPTHLVRVFCKGNCCCERWMQLDQPHPGRDAIKATTPGTYRATCPKCGHIATDNYNWG